MTRYILKYRVLKAFACDKVLCLPDDILFISSEYRFDERPIYVRDVYNKGRQYIGLIQREVGESVDNYIEEIKDSYGKSKQGNISHIW